MPQRKIVWGKRLSYNAGLQTRYIQQLNKLIKPMVTQVKREIIRLFNSPVAEQFQEVMATDESITSQARIITNKLLSRFETLFGRAAPIEAEKMVGRANKASKVALGESLKQLSGGLTIKTDFLTPGLKEVTKAAVVENVSLIKSIATEYLTNVQKAVMRSITNGSGLESLVPNLQKYEGITYRKAKNIALDQTRKAYNSINAGRMKKIGIKKFEWVHSGGGQKPRQDHIDMSGNIYSFDDLPIIDKKTGERGIPGQAINCKCTMIPVTEYDEESSE